LNFRIKIVESGKVDKQEIADFFAKSLTISNPTLSVSESEKQALAIANELIKEVDTSGDNQLSLKEVMVACEEDATYRSIFTAFSKGIASKLS
jgi:hypothetical protein